MFSISWGYSRLKCGSLISFGHVTPHQKSFKYLLKVLCCSLERSIEGGVDHAVTIILEEKGRVDHSREALSIVKGGRNKFCQSLETLIVQKEEGNELSFSR
ncbi:unnamed protein product [Spirodela intermedia]|uniref:Uncharacterized protein n=2 Tax=Spirodela intermedia TaxID=51605 RepID=A0A7I8K9A1_SPIIN|nr:unnamed protein product [Spirodela intermedia]CAA7394327.1 unnamed protein product [Spirodela intermedia]CAA7394340.1 unnamed protein product [Spirodela intermedia]